MDLDPIHQIQQQSQEDVQQEQDQLHPGAELAPQACSACKKQKRKCDKILPACSLCQRIGRPCDYRPESQLQAPSPEDFFALRQQVSDLEQLLRASAGVNRSITPAASNGHTSSNGSLSFTNGSSPSANNPLSSSSGSQFWGAPNAFPSLYFLDSNAFTYEKFQVRKHFIHMEVKHHNLHC